MFRFIVFFFLFFCRAAEFDKVTVSSLGNSSLNSYSPSQQTPPLTASQSLHESLSISTIDDDDDETARPTTGYDMSDDDSVNEIVLKVAEAKVVHDKGIFRQPSTTEYLPGMVHTLSPIGLLPQFPSWSLVCIGPSSVYSHSTGLPEHVQSGFLSGTNFLLPWDVHVRLEHAASWAASYEKSRSRKKPQPRPQPIGGDISSNGQVFILKIFIGCEYECPRGHRFIMNAPDKVVRGGAGIIRDSGSKVVFNDMPLYFPCACRSAGPKVAQLMRIHIVTPKAPVNVTLDPKVFRNWPLILIVNYDHVWLSIFIDSTWWQKYIHFYNRTDGIAKIKSKCLLDITIAIHLSR